MKILRTVFFVVLPLALSSFLFAAVPTEEGLLKNLNNADISGNLITIKSMVQNSGIAVGAVTETEAPKADYFKFLISCSLTVKTLGYLSFVITI